VSKAYIVIPAAIPGHYRKLVNEYFCLEKSPVSWPSRKVTGKTYSFK